MSAKQIQQQTGLTYNSALFLMHRIRWAMAEDYCRQPQLTATIEADETYIGGKPRFPGQHRRGGVDKAAIVALVERGGRVRSIHVNKVNANTIWQFIRTNNDRGRTRLTTDESRPYWMIGRTFAGGRKTVYQKGRAYAPGDVTTNTVEGVFSLLKRGLYGTFHSVSRKHLHRSLAEFDFRYNARNMDDGARTALAIRGGGWKRLRYEEPTVKAAA
jgi:hypothetical protein